MIQRLKDALPQDMGERRRFFGTLLVPLIIAIVAPVAHQFLGIPVGLTLAFQWLAIVSVVWIFLRAVRASNRSN